MSTIIRCCSIIEKNARYLLMKGKNAMKNKISSKIVAFLLILIIVATSGMPLYAKETGDKANSFRYENGQPIIKAVPFATLSPNAWKKIDGKWYYSNPISDSKRGIMFTDAWIDGGM